MLRTAPVLAYPNVNSDQPLLLSVDTSSSGIGFILSQKQKSDVSGKLKERPIYYGSTFLRENQRKFGSSDLEITGIAFAVKKLDSWLRGNKFTLITDYKGLLYMLKKRMDHLKPATARKLLFLQQYDFDIVHKHDINLQHVDCLSRLPRTGDDEQDDVEPYICNILALLRDNKQTIDKSHANVEQLNVDEVLNTQKLDPFYHGTIEDRWYCCCHDHVW